MECSGCLGGLIVLTSDSTQTRAVRNHIVVFQASKIRVWGGYMTKFSSALR